MLVVGLGGSFFVVFTSFFIVVFTSFFIPLFTTFSSIAIPFSSQRLWSSNKESSSVSTNNQKTQKNTIINNSSIYQNKWISFFILLLLQVNRRRRPRKFIFCFLHIQFGVCFEEHFWRDKSSWFGLEQIRYWLWSRDITLFIIHSILHNTFLVNNNWLQLWIRNQLQSSFNILILAFLKQSFAGLLLVKDFDDIYLVNHPFTIDNFHTIVLIH